LRNRVVNCDTSVFHFFILFCFRIISLVIPISCSDAVCIILDALTGTEGNELCAQVNLLLPRIASFKAQKLFSIPLLLALSILFLTTLILPGLDLGLAMITLCLYALVLFFALFLFLLVLFGALGTFDDHFLRAFDPFDVFDQSLLDLIVAHAAIEGLSQVKFLLPLLLRPF